MGSILGFPYSGKLPSILGFMLLEVEFFGMRGPILGVAILSARVIVFWGEYAGPLFFETSHSRVHVANPQILDPNYVH